MSYILTADDLAPISRPLRNGCRIIKIPDRGPEHVAQLVDHILADIANDRGVAARWYPALARDELEVINQTWVRGSIRQPRRAVELMLDGRDVRSVGRA